MQALIEINGEQKCATVLGNHWQDSAVVVEVDGRALQVDILYCTSVRSFSSQFSIMAKQGVIDLTRYPVRSVVPNMFDEQDFYPILSK